jgi:hypothetical protein
MTADDVDINDIAHSLSLRNRYIGHTKDPVNVAWHSCLVALAIRGGPRLQLCGLLHDAAESYIGDIVSPLKRHLPPELSSYVTKAEEHILSMVRKRFDLPPEFWKLPEVHDADMRALVTEVRDYIPARRLDWDLPNVEPLVYRCGGMDPFPPSYFSSETHFLWVFGQLQKFNTIESCMGYYRE